MTNEMAYSKMSAADKFRLRYGASGVFALKHIVKKENKKIRENHDIHSFCEIENDLRGK